MVMTTTEYGRRTQACREKLYRLAFCYVKNQQDALDIVSESVYRGLRQLRQLQDADRFELWMQRIVVNAALDHLRKHRCEPLPEDLPAEETGASAEETMDLYHALDRLPPEDRSYIILRFFEERSFREMSCILDVPESTVKSRIYRILEQLKHCLSM